MYYRSINVPITVDTVVAAESNIYFTLYEAFW